MRRILTTVAVGLAVVVVPGGIPVAIGYGGIWLYRRIRSRNMTDRYSKEPVLTCLQGGKL